MSNFYLLNFSIEWMITPIFLLNELNKGNDILNIFLYNLKQVSKGKNDWCSPLKDKNQEIWLLNKAFDSGAEFGRREWKVSVLNFFSLVNIKWWFAFLKLMMTNDTPYINIICNSDSVWKLYFVINGRTNIYDGLHFIYIKS